MKHLAKPPHGAFPVPRKPPGVEVAVLRNSVSFSAGGAAKKCLSRCSTFCTFSTIGRPNFAFFFPWCCHAAEWTDENEALHLHRGDAIKCGVSKRGWARCGVIGPVRVFL